MGVGSPTAYLLWAILSTMFLAFLLLHLWSYDRFSCLKWNAGRQPGAFKRVMTYSYLATVPLLVFFAISITALKFKEGYVSSRGNVFPRPFSAWTPDDKRWALPLFFVLSIAWSLELVTHLEELTFWVFLLNQGPSKRDWFASWEFRIWTIGSTFALIVMPVTVLITRRQIDTCLAYVFLIGSAAGTVTTILFLYVLARFPGFIQHVKAEGAEPEVVIRLATFYELNRIRVFFRFLFTLPLLLMGADGIGPTHKVTRNLFATDFLLILGGIGCLVSSGITLLIFFPRPITRELEHPMKYHPSHTKIPTPTPQYQIADPQMSSPKSVYAQFPENDTENYYPRGVAAPAFDVGQYPSDLHRPRNSMNSDVSPVYETDSESIGVGSQRSPVRSHYKSSRLMPTISSVPSSNDTIFDREHDTHSTRQRQRRYSDGHLFFDRRTQPITGTPWVSYAHEEGRRTNRSSLRLHPYVLNFTSPIDLMDGDDNEFEYGPQRS